MSKINVNTWEPESGTTITAGASGDTLAISADSVTGLNVGSDAAGDVLYNDGTDYTRLAKPGTPADEVLTFATGATAPSWVAAGGGGLNSVQTFTASGTWTRPADVTKVIMYVTGAGGGGKTAPGVGNCGGFSGATAIKFLDVSSVSSSTITIGTGGGGGTSPAAGGSAIWSDGANTITGGGGAAGVSGSADNTNARPVATGGDINLVGSCSYGPDSATGISFWGGGDSKATTALLPGEGGKANYAATGYAGANGFVYVQEFK